MVKFKGIQFNTTKIFMFFILAFVMLYITGVFMNAGGIPSDVDATILNSFKIIVIGIASFLAFILVTKVKAGAMTTKDIITLGLFAAGIWLLWDNVIVNIVNSPTISEISFAVVKKIGLVP